MKHFVAILLFERLSSDAAQEPLFEETTLLVQAGDKEEAFKKAEQYGKNYRPVFTNAYGAEITWRLAEVVNVNETLEEPGSLDVVSLNARFFKNREAYDTFSEMLRKA